MSQNNKSEYMDRILALNLSNDQVYQDTYNPNRQQLDDAIQKELDFIKDQVEIVKNDLRLCDSLSSGRRSKNQSVLSFTTLNNMQSRLNGLYGATSLQSTPRSQKSHPQQQQYSQELRRVLSQSKLQRNVNIPKAQEKKKRNIIINKQQWNNSYLFCLFTRLNNSQVMSLLSKNQIKVKQEDKCRTQYNQKIYTFKNNILTNYNDVERILFKNPQVKTIIIFGGKSTSKGKVIYTLINCLSNSCQIRSIKIDYVILGSINNSEGGFNNIPYSMISQNIKIYQMESRSISDFNEGYEQMIQNSKKQDLYYQTKQYFHEQLQLTQNGQQRKIYMNLLNKNMNCIKVFQVIIETHNNKQIINCITTNHIITLKQLVNENIKTLSNNDDGQQLILNVLQGIDDEELIKIYCINPLRYRLADSENLLNLMVHKQE